MEINYSLIFLASFLQFVLGALWYSPILFGKAWMEIMEVSNLKKEEIKKMQRAMMPYYGVQFLLTFITTWVLANNISFSGLTDSAVYYYAVFMWIGYIAPVQIAAVIWGRTKQKYWFKQVCIMISYQFVSILIAALVLSL